MNRLAAKLGPIWSLVLGFLFLLMVVALFVQMRDYYGPNPIVRQRLAVKEPFADKAAAGPVAGIWDLDRINRTVAPDEVEQALAKPREPYNLLNGWLQPAEAPLYPSAATCHEADFQIRLERTGNFRQLTNNYKRADPDSCSAPIQDLTLAFYKNEPLPQAGCLAKGQ
jgi:hypothetical protein